MGFQRLEEKTSAHVQRCRNAEETEHSGIAPPLLNLANIRATQSGLGSEGFLRKSLLLTVLTERGTEELQGWIRASTPFSHGAPIEEIMSRAVQGGA
jgi:hypothetical protein